ncbi:MAG: methylmalonyl-CoA mutase family protein [Deferribacteraceae bacterium]|nr:methylmalonyl-CoA mutase family protein [Deferribacteraceae bacterium]
MRQKWEELYLKSTGKAPERKKKFITTSGIEIKPFYSPDDLQGFNYEQKLGYPGLYPLTRGVQTTMYRSRFWTMRQYAGFATAEESNKRYRYLLQQGTTGLSVAFDLPTQIGYDSDDPLAEGEVGRVGVAIDSLADMETLFQEIPLGKVSTSMTINATASFLLACYIAVGEKQGVPAEKLSGTIQNDILKEYIARGTYRFPPKESMRVITDIFGYCAKNVPLWNTISISGYHIREAGSNAAQEIAFTLADGICYVQAAIDAGLDVDGFAGRLSFFFNCHNNFLEEIAKFRAARRVWANIMKNRFKAKDPRSWMLRFHTQTAGCSLTAQQPENNIVRVAVQTLAAAIGGTQSLHTNSFDEALALPTEKSVRIALRTQQIIANESGVADTIDPIAGSYAVEALTNELETKAETYISKIDGLGGMLRAIEHGYPQKEIQNSAYDYQLAIEKKDQIIVGLNEYKIDEEAPKDLLRIDPKVETIQCGKLKKLRASRDNSKVQSALQALTAAAESGENIMPRMVDAARVYVTIGEAMNALKKVFGEYKENIVL